MNKYKLYNYQNDCAFYSKILLAYFLFIHEVCGEAIKKHYIHDLNSTIPGGQAYLEEKLHTDILSHEFYFDS